MNHSFFPFTNGPYSFSTHAHISCPCNLSIKLISVSQAIRFPWKLKENQRNMFKQIRKKKKKDLLKITDPDIFQHLPLPHYSSPFSNVNKRRWEVLSINILIMRARVTSQGNQNGFVLIIITTVRGEITLKFSN